MRLALFLLGFVIGIGVGVYLSLPLSRHLVAIREFERRYEKECEYVKPVLAADPAYRKIVTVNFPVLGICLAGTTGTQADCDRLRAEMLRLFGEPRVGHVMGDVLVEKANVNDLNRK